MTLPFIAIFFCVQYFFFICFRREFYWSSEGRRKKNAKWFKSKYKSDSLHDYNIEYVLDCLDCCRRYSVVWCSFLLLYTHTLYVMSLTPLYSSRIVWHSIFSFNYWPVNYMQSCTRKSRHLHKKSECNGSGWCRCHLS